MTPAQEEAVNRRIHEEVMGLCWHDAAGEDASVIATYPTCSDGMREQVVKFPTCSKCGVANWTKNPNYLHNANAALQAVEKIAAQYDYKAEMVFHEDAWDVRFYCQESGSYGFTQEFVLSIAICRSIFAFNEWEWPE